MTWITTLPTHLLMSLLELHASITITKPIIVIIASMKACTAI